MVLSPIGRRWCSACSDHVLSDGSPQLFGALGAFEDCCLLVLFIVVNYRSGAGAKGP